MDGVRFDQVARVLGRRIGRRGVVAGVAAALGGAAVAGPVAANGLRPGVCRPVGAGCTRNSQCCSTSCATGRALPRRLRNRCACPEGLVSVGGRCVEECDPGLGPLGYCLYDLDGSMMYPCEMLFLDETGGEFSDPEDGVACSTDADCADIPSWRCFNDNCRCVTATVNENGAESFAPVCAFAVDSCG